MIFFLLAYAALGADRTLVFVFVERECVVYWYSFSNPRTKCIHGADRTLVFVFVV